MEGPVPFRISGNADRSPHLWRRVVAVAVVASLVWTGLATAQEPSAGGALISYSGEAVVTHPNGQSELARIGMPINAGDRVAVPSAGGAVIGYGDGSTVGLQPRTTLDFKQSEAPGGGPATVTAELSRGVVTAETPPNREAALRITSQAAGGVALLKQGEMAVGIDEGTSNMSVACDERDDRVFFPYEDRRVPCEQRIVRTLTSDGDIIDQPASGPLLSAVVEGGGERRSEGTQPGGQTEQRNQARGERRDNEDEQPVVAASPPSLFAAPCGVATTSGGAGVTTTVHDLGRTDGTFPFTWDAFFEPDTFEILYEGRQLFSTGPVSGTGSTSVAYGGASTQVTVRVTGTPGSPTTVWNYTVGCPAGIPPGS
jgi:hypothetical protein